MFRYKYQLCLETLLAIVSCSLFAHPVSKEVSQGQARFDCTDAQTLTVTTSDKAIINYRTFNIGENELVRFIQPSAKSCVLNRVVESNPSQILGGMQGNGRVFLVNPYGIVFGKNAQVNMGSFVASTLNISDDDFLNDKYRFYLEKGCEKSGIVNEGMIAAGEGGFVGIFSPTIQNRGSILAFAERILLGAGEKISLDFSGDGLIQFSVEGDLKQALIENYGRIESANGDVKISMRCAQKAIRSVVNTDGIVPATEIEEIDGCVCLIDRGSITAKNIDIAAPSVECTSSAITASQDLRIAAENLLKLRDREAEANRLTSGRYLTMEGDCIDILALSHPNSGILSGSDLVLISSNPISADAHFYSGGTFSLLKPNGGFADFISLVDPIISATGAVSFGAYSGVSLKVESTKQIIATGTINITGPDSAAPSGDSDYTTLSTYSALVLRSGLGSLEGYGLAVPPDQSAGGATFTSDGSTGTGITLGGDITWDGGTNGGNIILAGNITLSGSVAIHGNNSDAGVVSITGTIDGLAADTQSLTFNNSGAGISIHGAIGASKALKALSLSASSISIGSIGTSSTAGVNDAMTLTSAGDFTFTGSNYRTANTATYISGVGSSFTVNSGGTISFIAPDQMISLTNGTMHALATNVTFNPGNANLTIPSMGSDLSEFVTTIIESTGTVTTSGAIFSDSLSFVGTAPTAVHIGGNITTNNTALSFPECPVSLTASASLTTGSLTFANTLDGNGSNPDLSIHVASGNVSFEDDVGAVHALGSLNVTASGTITQAVTVQAAAVDYSGAAILLSSTDNDITTSGGAIRLFGAVTQTPALLTLNSSGGNITLAGASWIGNAGSENLTLNAGAGHIILHSPIGTALKPIGSLTLTNAGHVQLGAGIITNQNISFNNAVIRDLTASTITLDTSSGNHNITFNSTLNADGVITNPALTLTCGSGTISFLDTVGNSAALGALSATASTINLRSDVTTNGAVALTGHVVRVDPVSTTLDSNNHSITITGPLDGTISGNESWSLIAGTGDVTITSAIGATIPLNNLSISGDAIHLNGNIGTALVAGLAGGLTIHSTDAVYLNGTAYHSLGSQTVSAGTNINMTSGSPILFETGGGAIQFTSGAIQLSDGSDFQVQTNNGIFLFASLVGTSLENVNIDAGSGTATLGGVSGSVDSFHVDAGTILFSGAMTVGSPDFLSAGNVANTGSSVAITSTNDATFDAVGNIGSVASPVLVHSSGLIIAGWDDLAVFDGTSSDMTIHELPLSLCCELIFNGTIVHNCHAPTPTPTPASSRVIIPERLLGFSIVLASKNVCPSSNYFFFPNFLNSSYLDYNIPLYQKKPYTKRDSKIGFSAWPRPKTDF